VVVEPPGVYTSATSGGRGAVPGFGMIHPRVTLLSGRAPPYAYALVAVNTFKAEHQVASA
jgi:hypothetical protein